MSARHRPTIARWREETSQGEAWCYQARCSCGVEMDEHYARGRAVRDRDEHLAEVAPPPAERCRAPRAHGSRSWDRCPLCVDQLALPGLEAWGAVG
ncbi:hypothetical protein [Streptomonospora nanhaiensis]|uniref:Uncharacterized protein n=1 Tax=Streptomonospora nanhaiensis TaxID=1323731 RepID=A0A853BX13_9ACTN|nr:hypothetical protein [Streptomonospora nanhaiensis]MBV2367112.1 hypothetical protein [Streptomonospora nanhaiensis]NYI99295.1 hypothetical protein [Streptomonospora nanhaiensis]